jgi:hypothetical protein
MEICASLLVSTVQRRFAIGKSPIVSYAVFLLDGEPNHAFNRTRQYGPSIWRTPVAGRRLNWGSLGARLRRCAGEARSR